MDISSEMIHSLLPVFLVVGLGTSAAYLGLHRRRCRGDGVHRQGVLRGAVGLLRAAQALGIVGLWNGGVDQAALSARLQRGHDVPGALRRPARQRHPGSAARCLGCGRHPAGTTWRRLWSASVARYGWRIRRPGIGHAARGRLRRPVANCVVDRRGAGVHLRRRSVGWCSRANAATAPRRKNAASSYACARCREASGSSARWRAYSCYRGSPRHSWCWSGSMAA